jgi:hypothetical protein
MSDSLNPISGLVLSDEESPDSPIEFDFIVINFKVKGTGLQALEIEPGSELEQKFIAFLESSINSGLI